MTNSDTDWVQCYPDGMRCNAAAYYKLTTDISDPRDFGKWLERFGAGEVVGYVQSSGQCPIATYLVQRHGYEPGTVRVMGDWVSVEATSDGIVGDVTSPQWLEQFTRRVDATGTWAQAVTSSTALDILTGAGLVQTD